MSSASQLTTDAHTASARNGTRWIKQPIVDQLLANDLCLVFPTRSCDECPTFGSDDISPRRRPTICPAYQRRAVCWFERNRLPLPDLTTADGRADATRAYLHVTYNAVMLRHRIESACGIDTRATVREMLRLLKLTASLMKCSCAGNASLSQPESVAVDRIADAEESTDP